VHKYPDWHDPEQIPPLTVATKFQEHSMPVHWLQLLMELQLALQTCATLAQAPGVMQLSAQKGLLLPLLFQKHPLSPRAHSEQSWVSELAAGQRAGIEMEPALNWLEQ
jgi:hypothetical protein